MYLPIEQSSVFKLSKLSKLFVLIGFFAIYLLLFHNLLHIYGQGLSVLIIIPVIHAAWAFGLNAGIFSAILSFPINLYLFIHYNLPVDNTTLMTGFSGTGAFIIVASAIGHMQDIMDDLDKSNHTKDEFLGIAAHDLRNPLAAINESLSLLSSGSIKTKEMEARVHSLMSESVEKMMILLDDLLSINRLDTPVMDVDKSKINLEDYLQNINSHNRMLAGKKNIKLKFQNNAGKKYFFFHESQISQVINNFISNGIKFSPLETTVTVTADIIDDSHLKISVTNRGQGIPKEEHKLVFSQFSNISSKPTGGEVSTGLGLYICKNMIKKNDGTVGFSSEPGKETTFYFILKDCVVDE